LAKADLLICDEWGYVPPEQAGPKLLFWVISDCYEQRSVMITTNLEFSNRANVFYDEQMTAARIDRLVHQSCLLVFDGSSYWIKHSLMKTLLQTPWGLAERGLCNNEEEMFTRDTVWFRQ